MVFSGEGGNREDERNGGMEEWKRMVEESELGGVSSRKTKAAAESTPMWNAHWTNLCRLQVNRVDCSTERRRKTSMELS